MYSTKKCDIFNEMICIDDTLTSYITLNNTYNIIDIYSADNKIILLIEDDEGYLNGYDSIRFINKMVYRDNILDNILD